MAETTIWSPAHMTATAKITPGAVLARLAGRLSHLSEKLGSRAVATIEDANGAVPRAVPLTSAQL